METAHTDVARNLAVASGNFVIAVFSALLFFSVSCLCMPDIFPDFELARTIRVKVPSEAKVTLEIHLLAEARLSRYHALELLTVEADRAGLASNVGNGLP